jgi:hypothetical protein
MPTATDSENIIHPTCTRPIAVRLRRMLDASLLERAYGRGAHDRVPVEIIDLDDGSRLCEWDDGVSVVGQRMRYASEADMWRDLHALAGARGMQRTVPFYSTRLWSSAAPAAMTASDAMLESMARADAARDLVAENVPGLDVDDMGGAREAWIDREIALLAIIIDEDDLDLPLRFLRWVAVPGKADDRELDTLGRPNGRGPRKHGSTASRTLRV